MAPSPLFTPAISLELHEALVGVRAQYTKILKAYADRAIEGGDILPYTSLRDQLDRATETGMTINGRYFQEMAEMCQAINNINTVLSYKEGVADQGHARIFTKAVIDIMESSRHSAIDGIGQRVPLDRPEGAPADHIDLSTSSLVSSYLENFAKLAEQGARHCSFIERNAFQERKRRVVEFHDPDNAPPLEI